MYKQSVYLCAYLFSLIELTIDEKQDWEIYMFMQLQAF